MGSYLPVIISGWPIGRWCIARRSLQVLIADSLADLVSWTTDA